MGKTKKAKFGKLTLGDETRVTAGHAHHRKPAWSRDGRHLAFAVGQHDDSAWVVTDRRGRIARTIEGPADGCASFGPDGSIAVERRFGATSEIWMTPGSDLPAVRLLGGDGALYHDPAISPDGTTLACATASEPEATTSLVLLSLQSGQRVQVTKGARADRHPAFSPDGTELFFEGAEGVDHAIWVVHLVNGTLTRLTSAEEHACRPAVIDAQFVVYERHDGDGRVRLCLLERGEHTSASLIADDDASRTEAACHLDNDGKVKLAYAAQHTRTDGEPPRFDIHVARLKGIHLAVAAEPAPAKGPPS